MPISPIPLIPTIRKIAGRLGNLLSEAHPPCPICRVPARSAAPHPFIQTALPRDAQLRRVCRSCASAIPWIEHIACVVCGRPDPCPDCLRRSDAHFIVSRSAVRYDDSVREWLALFKYRGNERLAHPLGDMLDIAFTRLDRELRSRVPTHRWDAIIPVPVSADRLLERGFNQAERLAALLCARRQIPLADLLVRTRHSEKKSLQSRLARLLSVDGLFVADHFVVAAFMNQTLSTSHSKLSRHSSIHPSTHPTVAASQSPIRLLIVDDIYTTGSTIDACAEALHQVFGSQAPHLQVEVYAITLARS